ncbi:MAG: sugar ABC transporter permease, partial [Clostridiales bacterium]|nr:sugar ABC transporter permease [Clostridiales bacterium]
KGVQTIICLPHFLSWVIVASLFIPLFSISGGLVNNILVALGLEKISFMMIKGWWVAIYVFLGIWKEFGWGTIIYLAALTAVSPELCEAAEIDGASRFKQILHVHIPSIAPTIIVLFIMNIGKVLTIGFDQPYLLGNSSVLDVSDVISTYVYRVGIVFGDFSRSTAVGLFQGLVSLPLLFLANYLSRRYSDDSIF